MALNGNTPPEITGLGEIQQQSPLLASLRAQGFAMSDEMRQNIENALQKDQNLNSAMQRDISATLKNSTERDRFETMYIKGYGQLVEMKSGEKVTLAELLKRERNGESNILTLLANRGEMKQYSDFKTQLLNQVTDRTEGKKEALNQKAKEEEGVDGALNQDRDKLITLGESMLDNIGKAKQAMDPAGLSQFESLKKTELQQIQTAPEKSPIVARLQKEGASIADIQSGKYANFIDAYILTQHATELTPRDAEKAKVFRTAVSQLGETMGIEATTKNIQPFLESKVLGTDRAKITNTLETAVNTGKYETMRWDKDTRSIILDGKGGEKRIIETAQIPPKESIEKNGLRISREIQPISKEEQEKNEKDKILTQRVLDTKKSESNYADFVTGDRYKESYAALSEKAEIKTLIAEKETLQKDYEAITATGKKVEKIGTMLKKVTDINEMRKKDSTLLTNTSIENTLETEKFVLQDTLRNLSLQELAEKNVPKGAKEKGDDGFENSANYNLNFLSKIGYDGIGQDNMERIIRTLNSSDNPSRTSVGEIDLGQKLDTPKTQALTLAIANLVRNGRTSTGQQSEEQKKQEQSQKSYDNVDKSDPYIAARQTQSLGFRESLSSVARNMSQEGGSLKTDSAMKKVLFGIDPRPEATSAINTKIGESQSTTTLA